MKSLQGEKSFYCLRKGDERQDLRDRGRKNPFRYYMPKYTVRNEDVLRGTFSDRRDVDGRGNPRKKYDTHELRTHADIVGHD
jgi:hypothetical protein